MANNLLTDTTKNLAIDIISFCRKLETDNKEYIISKQLLRSGTSIGANVHEASYAQSKADFISKFQIALKECYETEYWLELTAKSELIANAEICAKLTSKIKQIRFTLIRSLKTAKGI